MTATSADNAWAVGEHLIKGGGSRSLIEHWNGRIWQIVPSPSPGPSGGYPGFAAVAATSADDAWAVGSYDAGPPLFEEPLIAHWNGRAWTQVPTPPVAARLSGVAATSARNAWAVGSIFGPVTRAVALHWNGRAWRRVPVANAQNVQLAGVTAAGGCPSWAVGATAFPQSQQSSALIYRWTGRAWVPVPSPNPGGSASLNGVREARSCRAWAVGGYYTDRNRSLVERWNGRAWTLVPSPL